MLKPEDFSMIESLIKRAQESHGQGTTSLASTMQAKLDKGDYTEIDVRGLSGAARKLAQEFNNNIGILHTKQEEKNKADKELESATTAVSEVLSRLKTELDGIKTSFGEIKDVSSDVVDSLESVEDLGELIEKTKKHMRS